ncbi:hypothetical protein KIPB_009343, partial [Kipferlia bialata]
PVRLMQTGDQREMSLDIEAKAAQQAAQASTKKPKAGGTKPAKGDQFGFGTEITVNPFYGANSYVTLSVEFSEPLVRPTFETAFDTSMPQTEGEEGVPYPGVLSVLSSVPVPECLPVPVDESDRPRVRLTRMVKASLERVLRECVVPDAKEESDTETEVEDGGFFGDALSRTPCSDPSLRLDTAKALQHIRSEAFATELRAEMSPIVDAYLSDMGIGASESVARAHVQHQIQSELASLLRRTNPDYTYIRQERAEGEGEREADRAVTLGAALAASLDMEEVVSGYRLLRVSLERLWERDMGEVTPALVDMTSRVLRCGLRLDAASPSEESYAYEPIDIALYCLRTLAEQGKCPPPSLSLLVALLLSLDGTEAALGTALALVRAAIDPLERYEDAPTDTECPKWLLWTGLMHLYKVIRAAADASGGRVTSEGGPVFGGVEEKLCTSLAAARSAFLSHAGSAPCATFSALSVDTSAEWLLAQLSSWCTSRGVSITTPGSATSSDAPRPIPVLAGGVVRDPVPDARRKQTLDARCLSSKVLCAQQASSPNTTVLSACDRNTLSQLVKCPLYWVLRGLAGDGPEEHTASCIGHALGLRRLMRERGQGEDPFVSPVGYDLAKDTASLLLASLAVVRLVITADEEEEEGEDGQETRPEAGAVEAKDGLPAPPTMPSSLHLPLLRNLSSLILKTSPYHRVGLLLVALTAEEADERRSTLVRLLRVYPTCGAGWLLAALYESEDEGERAEGGETLPPRDETIAEYARRGVVHNGVQELMELGMGAVAVGVEDRLVNSELACVREMGSGLLQ